jgi:hypothetical protein
MVRPIRIKKLRGVLAHTWLSWLPRSFFSNKANFLFPHWCPRYTAFNPSREGTIVGRVVLFTNVASFNVIQWAFP